MGSFQPVGKSMKKFLLASAIALATASAAIAPTQAATIVVKTNDHMHMRMHNKHCRTKWVTHWRHHRKIVEKVTVCR
jgi:Spy/CpxP family protein refolding chaperone